MFEITIKFESDADKESFISSISESFNRSGYAKSVHANTLERVGDTLFFTRQTAEPIEEATAAAVEEADFSELSETSSASEGESEAESVPENNGNLPTVSDTGTEEVPNNDGPNGGGPADTENLQAQAEFTEEVN